MTHSTQWSVTRSPTACSDAHLRVTNLTSEHEFLTVLLHLVWSEENALYWLVAFLQPLLTTTPLEPIQHRSQLARKVGGVRTGGRTVGSNTKVTLNDRGSCLPITSSHWWASRQLHKVSNDFCHQIIRTHDWLKPTYLLTTITTRWSLTVNRRPVCLDGKSALFWKYSVTLTFEHMTLKK